MGWHEDSERMKHAAVKPATTLKPDTGVSRYPRKKQTTKTFRVQLPHFSHKFHASDSRKTDLSEFLVSYVLAAQLSSVETLISSESWTCYSGVTYSWFSHLPLYAQRALQGTIYVRASSVDRDCFVRSRMRQSVSVLMLNNARNFAEKLFPNATFCLECTACYVPSGVEPCIRRGLLTKHWTLQMFPVI